MADFRTDRRTDGQIHKDVDGRERQGLPERITGERTVREMDERTDGWTEGAVKEVLGRQFDVFQPVACPSPARLLPVACPSPARRLPVQPCGRPCVFEAGCSVKVLDVRA